MGEDCVSPSRHSAFSTPIELMQFIAQLRELSGGKPVGFKFCLGHPWEFMGIAKAMLETGILPDFIVVDGKEGGTGAAPLEFTDHIGVPLREGLLFVHNTLVGLNLRDKIKVGASGKIVSAFDIASVLATGADWANSARGFMFAIGCIQSQSCHTNKCPTGVATQDPLRQRALVVPDKAERVRNFHRNTLKGLAEMLAAAGLEHPSQLEAKHLVRRITDTEIRLFSQLHYFPQTGRTAFRQDRGRVLRAHVEHGAGRQLRRGGLSRRPHARKPEASLPPAFHVRVDQPSRMVAQVTVITVRATNCAALPMSLAFFDRGWRSSETRSTVASIAELSSSTISASRHTAIISARSPRLTSRRKATGISTTLSSTSWRKAASPRKAARKPARE